MPAVEDGILPFVGPQIEGIDYLIEVGGQMLLVFAVSEVGF
jgi:hypothetical protein